MTTQTNNVTKRSTSPCFMLWMRISTMESEILPTNSFNSLIGFKELFEALSK